MTKIAAVTIDGLCGLNERVAFGPVSVFHGPNGSGKSTILGAVAYALTGRFPRIVGATAESLQALASDPAGFLVTIEAATATGPIVLVRGLQKGKRLLSIEVGGHTVRNVGDATALIRKHFGDVDWFVDMFDPERSFWRMSQEKRSRWMFELCASASGWSKERVFRQLGVSPTRREIDEARRAADDAEGFDEAMFVANFQGQSGWNPHIGRDAAANVELNMEQLEQRLLSTQRVARESVSIADGIAAPTLAPTPEQLAAAEDELRSALMECERARQAKVSVKEEVLKLDESIAEINADLLVAEIATAAPPTHCPTCMRPLDGAYAARVTDDLMKKMTALHARIAETQTRRDALGATMATEELSMQAAHARYIAANDAAVTLRQQDGVARERAGQLAAAEGAEERITKIKQLLEEARGVRRAMVRDSIEPLRKALALLGPLAPQRGNDAWVWWVDSDGSFKMVLPGVGAPTIAGGRYDAVTVEAMSAGEKYRATIALLVATSMIRREPWVGLFLDAFEQVSADARDAVTTALVDIQRTGHVDNVFVAGAYEDADGGKTVGGVTRFARRRS